MMCRLLSNCFVIAHSPDWEIREHDGLGHGFVTHPRQEQCLCLTVHIATALHLLSSACTLYVTSTVMTRMHVRSSIGAHSPLSGSSVTEFCAQDTEHIHGKHDGDADQEDEHLGWEAVCERVLLSWWRRGVCLVLGRRGVCCSWEAWCVLILVSVVWCFVLGCGACVCVLGNHTPRLPRSTHTLHAYQEKHAPRLPRTTHTPRLPRRTHTTRPKTNTHATLPKTHPPRLPRTTHPPRLPRTTHTPRFLRTNTHHASQDKHTPRFPRQAHTTTPPKNNTHHAPKEEHTHTPRSQR